ncbi:MAG: guanylate kinase, partial [Ruminiclostridium sp.]|nr:guanylate kinase [Ruminiclostridium sp.]
GKDVVLKIEIEGAMNVRKLFPDCTTVFILPPSFGELERRLRKRGTETEEVIKQRLETARRELSFADKYDFLVTNDALDVAVDDFLAIVRAEKCRRTNRTGAVEELLAE